MSVLALFVLPALAAELPPPPVADAPLAPHPEVAALFEETYGVPLGEAELPTLLDAACPDSVGPMRPETCYQDATEVRRLKQLADDAADAYSECLGGGMIVLDPFDPTPILDCLSDT